MSLDNWTRIVWPWEPELGVKDIFGGIPTLPSLSDFSVDIYLYIVYLIIIFKSYPSKHQLIHVYYL